MKKSTPKSAPGKIFGQSTISPAVSVENMCKVFKRERTLFCWTRRFPPHFPTRTQSMKRSGRYSPSRDVPGIRASVNRSAARSQTVICISQASTHRIGGSLSAYGHCHVIFKHGSSTARAFSVK